VVAAHRVGSCRRIAYGHIASTATQLAVFYGDVMGFQRVIPIAIRAHLADLPHRGYNFLDAQPIGAIEIRSRAKGTYAAV
jgi:hypothetical protein